MSAITSTLASSAVPASATNRPDRMANVEKALNMSASDLRSALQSGSSLSDIATKQGVSRDDLLTAIKTDLQNRPQRPGGDGDGDGPGATDATGAASETDRLTKMANAMADRKGVEGHHRHHHGGSGAGLTPATSSSETAASQLATGDGVDLQL
jgi:hypothetical protein